MTLAPFNSSVEPNQGNVRHWLDNLYSKFQPVEQARWNQSNIDTLFYAGNQSFINRQFSFSPTTSAYQYYFNLVQQPINMITGYERQHRKSIKFDPAEGADSNTTDQYTRLIMHEFNAEGLHEQRSKAKELASIAGMVLVQPYLDYTSEDQAQGSLRLKIWEYNSFLVDPYFRNPDMSDAQFIWCQEYISKEEADARFPDKKDQIKPMSGSPQRYGNFYFLPENNNMSNNNLMVLSYVWYKWRTKKKRLYSRSRQQFFDFSNRTANLEEILYNIRDLEEVTVECPCWKVAVILNDQLMFQGENPMGFQKCPMVPYFWNYDPHVNYPDLRVRSLIRPMRDPQFLFNYKVITNNDITAATINAGWKRKSGAVANEDNLKKSGQGWDVIINEGYEMTDCEKIIPSGVPESDIALAQQMADLIYSTSGVNLENWAGQDDKQISSLTMMMKQAANLMVFQKYFDQWDYADKLLGDVCIQIVLNMWNEAKVGLILGEEPSPHFYSKIFAKYKVIVEPGLLTPTQKNLQAQQMMDINQAFGREVIPPSMIIKDMNIQGKSEIMEYMQSQEQQASAAQAEETNIRHAFESAKLQELYSKATANIAAARERDGRKDANIGLFEERLSEITQNRAMATKAKMEALEKLVDIIGKYGEIEAAIKMNNLEGIEYRQEEKEDRERIDARRMALANEFKASIMGSNQMGQNQMSQQQM